MCARLNARSPCDLPSGTGSRLGTGVGVGYRAGALARTHRCCGCQV